MDIRERWILIGVSILMGAAAKCGAEEPILWIASFNEGKLVTNYNGGIGAWQFDPNDRSSWCEATLSPEEVHFGEPGYSMKIEYKVSSGKENYVSGQNNVSVQEVGFHGQAFNGIYMILNGMDVSNYKFLVFSARGDAEAGFSRQFKIELKDQERVQSMMFDRLTSKWQKFYVPLEPFSTGLNLKELKEIVFVFDRMVSRTSGAMYVDDIYFGKTKGEDQKADSARAEEASAIRAPKAKSIVVDGNLSDWSGDATITLGSENQEFGTVRNKRDLAGNFRFSWDNRYLYFGAEIRDNEIVCEKTGKEIYYDDLVELFIDPQNDGLVWSSSSDFQIGFAPAGPEHKPQVWAWFQGKEPSLDEIIYNAKLTRNGYVIEAAISWDFLKINPADNRTIGVSPSVHDVDRKKKKTETKLNWRFVQNPVDATRHSLGILELGEK